MRTLLIVNFFAAPFSAAPKIRVLDDLFLITNALYINNLPPPFVLMGRASCLLYLKNYVWWHWLTLIRV